MEIKKELDILIGMIQRPTGIRLGCNFEMYKDDVTHYRETLYNQAMKIRKSLSTQAPKKSQDNNIRIIKPKSLDAERKKIGVRQ